MKPEIRDVLKRVDWLRVVHRLSTIGRALREDDDLNADLQTDQARSQKLLQSIDGAARKALNCHAPNPCTCPMCEEEKQP